MGSKIVKIDGEEPVCNAGDPGLIPSQEDPQRKEWLPTPVFLPGESYGQSSLGTVHGATKSQTGLRH